MNPQEKAEELHAKSKIIEVDPSKIKVDRSYQRQPSMKIVDKIVEDYDMVASELVTVSDRGRRPADGDVEGGMFIVNGQHRMLAAIKMGLGTVWARVIDLRNDPNPTATEAALRLKTNVRLADRAQERFKAQIAAGDEDSVAIVRLLADFDTELNLTHLVPDEGINAVSTIESLYQYDQGALLRDTLQTVKDSYQVVGGKNVSAPFLKGLAWFIEQHAHESDRDRVVGKLTDIGPGALARRAVSMQGTMGGSTWVNYYRAIVDLYNEKLADRNRLTWTTRGAQKFRRLKASEADAGRD